jgi:DNA-binding MarR family transcriptional regulator
MDVSTSNRAVTEGYHRFLDRMDGAARDKTLTGWAKPVLVALALLSRDDGTLYRDPTQTELVTLVGCKKHTIQRALKHLEAGGWIARTRKPRKAGTAGYSYRLNLRAPTRRQPQPYS